MEKYNFKIDSANKTVSVNVSPSVFKREVVLHATYHFIDDCKVIVDGEEDKITVTLIPNEKVEEADLEELAYEFNIQLVSSSVEEEESKKYAETRETMMKAALSPRPFPPKTQGSKPSETPPKES